MKVKYFESEDFMGFEVTNAQEVICSIHLGMDFLNQHGDVINADFEDEDGEEREPNDSELMEDILKRIREGETVYAGTYMPQNIRVFENCATVVASNFKVGQKVFYMYENKVWCSPIVSINFTNKDNYIYKATYKVGSLTYKESEIFATKEELIQHLMEG